MPPVKKKKQAVKPVKKGGWKFSPEERYATAIKKVWNGYVDRIEERYEWAQHVFQYNDQITALAVEDMMEVMTRMAQIPHPPRIMIRVPFKNNKGTHEFMRDIPPALHEKTLYFSCAAICVSLHEWGIRFANFKPPKRLKPAPGRENV